MREESRALAQPSSSVVASLGGCCRSRVYLLSLACVLRAPNARVERDSKGVKASDDHHAAAWLARVVDTECECARISARTLLVRGEKVNQTLCSVNLSQKTQLLDSPKCAMQLCAGWTQISPSVNKPAQPQLLLNSSNSSNR